jgi:nucleoside-diphosphate-sugar epimerase
MVKSMASSCSEIRVGTTETTRDFIHVEDVVQAICAALVYDSGKYDVFNVGTGRATSIRQVLRILLDAAGDDRPVVEDKTLFRTYDRPSLTADIRKIRRAMDWVPAVGLEDGLTRLVQETILLPS